jgi:hypothetical protein
MGSPAHSTVRKAYSPPHEEGNTRHQEKVYFRIGAAGVVAHTEIWLVSDHPVCGAKVGFAEIFLMQPPLLTRRGIRLHAYCTIPPQSCVRSLNCVRRIECGHVRLMSGDPPQDVHALGIG